MLKSMAGDLCIPGSPQHSEMLYVFVTTMGAEVAVGGMRVGTGVHVAVGGMVVSVGGIAVGVAGIVKFDNGLSFIETITSWDEFKSVSFSIRPNHESPAPAPFNMVGGRYFAVTEMKYWIEDTDDGSVILHLHSQHHLTTNFNAYAGASIWTDFMLGNLQAYVLRMIKVRAESSLP